MGRYFEQTESRSELQQRIAADLREKAAQKAKQEGEPVPGVSGELIENSEYLKGTKATTTLAPAWGVYCTDGSWRICVIRISGE